MLPAPCALLAAPCYFGTTNSVVPGLKYGDLPVYCTDTLSRWWATSCSNNCSSIAVFKLATDVGPFLVARLDVGHADQVDAEHGRHRRADLILVERERGAGKRLDHQPMPRDEPQIAAAMPAWAGRILLRRGLERDLARHDLLANLLGLFDERRDGRVVAGVGRTQQDMADAQFRAVEIALMGLEISFERFVGDLLLEKFLPAQLPADFGPQRRLGLMAAGQIVGQRFLGVLEFGF